MLCRLPAFGFGLQFTVRQPLDLDLSKCWRELTPIGNAWLPQSERLGRCVLRAAEVLNDLYRLHGPIIAAAIWRRNSRCNRFFL